MLEGRNIIFPSLIFSLPAILSQLIFFQCRKLGMDSVLKLEGMHLFCNTYIIFYWVELLMLFTGVKKLNPPYGPALPIWCHRTPQLSMQMVVPKLSAGAVRQVPMMCSPFAVSLHSLKSGCKGLWWAMRNSYMLGFCQWCQNMSVSTFFLLF